MSERNAITLVHIDAAIKNNMRKLIIIKYVVIETWSKQIQYYVHGKLMDINIPECPKILLALTDLPAILSKFEKMQVCKGLNSLKNTEFIKNDGFQDSANTWHSLKCLLLTKRNVCNECRIFYKTVWQRKNRFKEIYERKRVHRVRSI